MSAVNGRIKLQFILENSFLSCHLPHGNLLDLGGNSDNICGRGYETYDAWTFLQGSNLDIKEWKLVSTCNYWKNKIYQGMSANWRFEGRGCVSTSSCCRPGLDLQTYQEWLSTNSSCVGGCRSRRAQPAGQCPNLTRLLWGLVVLDWPLLQVFCSCSSLQPTKQLLDLWLHDLPEVDFWHRPFCVNENLSVIWLKSVIPINLQLGLHFNFSPPTDHPALNKMLNLRFSEWNYCNNGGREGGLVLQFYT